MRTELKAIGAQNVDSNSQSIAFLADGSFDDVVDVEPLGQGRYVGSAFIELSNRSRGDNTDSVGCRQHMDDLIGQPLRA